MLPQEQKRGLQYDKMKDTRRNVYKERRMGPASGMTNIEFYKKRSPFPRFVRGIKDEKRRDYGFKRAASAPKTRPSSKKSVSGPELVALAENRRDCKLDCEADRGGGNDDGRGCIAG